MNAILISPINKRISEFVLNDDPLTKILEIDKILGDHTTDDFHTFSNGDVLYASADGIDNFGDFAFLINIDIEEELPIFGNAIIIGNYESCKSNIDEIRKKTAFMNKKASKALKKSFE